MSDSTETSDPPFNGVDTRWKKNRLTGEETMPELQEEFLEWLLTDPRLPASQGQWAREHGINDRSVKRWKADPRFIAKWEEAARKKNISVDRVQRVVDSLFNAATITGDVKAASLYLQYIDRFTPRKAITIEDRSTKDLSDEQLMAELAELASEVQL